MQKNVSVPTVLLFLFFTLLNFTACNARLELMQNQANLELSLSPGNYTLPVSTSLTFSGSGGSPPYTYSLSSGSGSLNSSTGLYTAPGTPGSDVLRVTDQTGAFEEITITIVAALALTPSSVLLYQDPSSTYQISGLSGGVTPYQYDLVSGPGTINSSGNYTMPFSWLDTIAEISDGYSTPVTLTIKNRPYSIANGSVYSAAVHGDDLYLIGSFEALNDKPASHLVAIHPTTHDLIVAPCNLMNIVTGEINAMAKSGDNLFIAGAITAVNSVTVPYIAKINLVSCTLDTTFTQATGFNSQVREMLIVGGSLYVGGDFGLYRGQSAQGIAKLDLVNGDLDLTFTPATAFNSYVSTLVSDGTHLYVGGNFTTYNGATAQRLAKLHLTTGVLDTTFTTATGANDYIMGAAIYGSHIYIAGNFTTYRGSPATRVAKILLSTGALDTTFSQATGANIVAYGIAVDNSGVYLAGLFTTYRGLIANQLAKLDLTDGSLDTTFTSQSLPGFNHIEPYYVTGVFIDGNYVYPTGAFSSYRGYTATNIAKISKTDGSIDQTFSRKVLLDTGIIQTVNSVIFDTSAIYIGGLFWSAGGIVADGLAKISLLTGEVDTTFTKNNGFSGSNAYPTSIAFSGSSAYIGVSSATQTTYRGITIPGLLKISLVNGDLDTTFTQASGFNSRVEAVEVFDSSLYVGGNFTSYRGNTLQRIARINLTDGTLDTTFSQTTGFSSTVNVIKGSGTNLYVGGNFTTFRSATALYLAKIDKDTGNLDGTFNQATGLNGAVNDLQLSGPQVYAGGAFTTYQGQPAQRLVSLFTSTGALDTTFTQTTGANNTVDKILIDGSELFFAGSFTQYRSTDAPRLAKINLVSGNLDTTFTQATGHNGAVTELQMHGNHLYLVGSFTSFRGETLNSFFGFFNSLSRIHKNAGTLD